MSRKNARAGLLTGASLAMLVLAAPALADDLRADSAITAVTVFPSGAAVVRTATVTLPSGDTTVVIDGLPDELDADSLKVSGSGDTAVAIASVETVEMPADADSDPRRAVLTDAIQQLQDKVAAIDDRLSALDARKRFLEQLVEQAPNGFGKALAAGNGNISGWNGAAEAVGSGLSEVADAVRAATVEKRGLGKQLDAEQQALADLPAPAEHKQVRIAVSAEAAGMASLSVTYQVASATWKPTYDAELDTGDKDGTPSLTLVRRAAVTQATGEDWSGVQLALSTARTEGGTDAPDLQPVLVSLYDADKYAATEAPPPPAPMMRAFDQAANSDAVGGMAAPKPATVIEAAADFGDYHAEYDVPGTVSVASGKGARSVQLGSETLDPKLSVRTAPALAETAYLTASFASLSGAPLLAGPVALFRDGSFVGNGAVAFSEAGKTIDLGFGVDDLVHVTRATVTEQTGQRGFIVNARKTDERRYKITVQNLHAHPLEITVLDRVPYAEDKAVTVTPSSDATQPTVTNVDDRRGVLAWTYTYDAGQSRDIVNAYQVSWPSDRDIVTTD
ncbi:MAG TPA: mucoidy inhibitor MuiA family protein [Bauldia sp.]|nr:mucoidy inhibitor MuiA family protein [Bauldia sp.]